MTGVKLSELAARLPASVPFVGPEAQERARGHRFAARIGANENVFGPSPAAIEAMRRAAGEVWKYADPENHDLRMALAAHHRVAPENVMVGEGIDGLLGYLVRLMIAPGDRVVTSLGGYPTFNYHVTGYGGDLVSVPYRDDAEDTRALVRRAAEVGARMVYLANPDNPMGSWHDARRVAEMIEALPDNCLLVLDEAYIEFAPEGTAPPLDPEDGRVIRMRTFSKAYGLAGARVGYALGPAELIDAFNRVRNHFAMGRISQAGAQAALADRDWLQQTLEKVANARRRLARIAAGNGLRALPSAANFVAIDCGRDAAFARAVLDGLVARGVFVRMPFVSPQNRCIRVSAGTSHDLDVFARALPDALEQAGRG